MDLSFKVNETKCSAVYTWIRQYDPKLSKIQQIRVLYLADRIHLRAHLRPILGLSFYQTETSLTLIQDLPFKLHPDFQDHLSASDVEALTQALIQEPTWEPKFSLGPINPDLMIQDLDEEIQAFLRSWSSLMVI